MRCVGVVGSIVPSVMRAVFTISLRGLCVWFVRPAMYMCREQGCATHCGSAAHASDVPRSQGVRCARRGSGVRVPCRAWKWSACTPSALRTAVRQVVLCAA
jgi:hypothetical protein